MISVSIGVISVAIGVTFSRFDSLFNKFLEYETSGFEIGSNFSVYSLDIKGCTVRILANGLTLELDSVEVEGTLTPVDIKFTLEVADSFNIFDGSLSSDVEANELRSVDGLLSWLKIDELFWDDGPEIELNGAIKGNDTLVVVAVSNGFDIAGFEIVPLSGFEMTAIFSETLSI